MLKTQPFASWEWGDSLQKRVPCSCASAAATFLFADHQPCTRFLLTFLVPPAFSFPTFHSRTLQEGKKESLLLSMSNGRPFLTYFIPCYFDILKLKQDQLAVGPASSVSLWRQVSAQPVRAALDTAPVQAVHSTDRAETDFVFLQQNKAKSPKFLPYQNPLNLILLPCPAQHHPILIFLHKD